MIDPQPTRRDFLHTTLASRRRPWPGRCRRRCRRPAPDCPPGLWARPASAFSIICLGGWHIGCVKDEKEAIKIMHAAIDEGLTFFDNAWDYHDGGSEDIMGKALATDGKRKKVFLMTKNCARDAKGTRQHLEDSLQRLQTDVIDLWQFHEINYDNDPDWIVDRGPWPRR